MPSLKDLYNRGVVEIIDDTTSLGNGFESLRFSGSGVDLTDTGARTAIVNITGGGGSGGGTALTVKNSDDTTIVNDVDTITVAGLLLTDEGNGDVTIFGSGGSGSPLFTFTNQGIGEGEVYKQTSGSEVQFRKIKSGDNISIIQTQDEIIINSLGGSSGGTTQFNLQEFQNSTTNISDGSYEDMEITGELSLLLAAIETNVPAMVRLYTSAASRLEDIRAAGDPIVNTVEGLVAEVETTLDDLRIDLSPVVAFLNLESPQTRSIFVRVFNQSGGEQSVNVKVIGSTIGVAIPGASKGDMLVHDGVQYQVQEVGTDGFKLVADSTSPTGVRWVEDTGGSSLPGDSKGDILVYDGNEYVKVPIGVPGQGLQVDPDEPAGVKWANFNTGGGGIGDTFIPVRFLGASNPAISVWGDVDPFANQKTIIEVDYIFKAVNLNTTIADQDIITEVTQLNSN